MITRRSRQAIRSGLAFGDLLASLIFDKGFTSAVESDLAALEHHGLNRCLDVGLAGYLRYVGWGVLAFNLHQIGREVLARARAGWPRARGLKAAGVERSKQETGNGGLEDQRVAGLGTATVKRA